MMDFNRDYGNADIRFFYYAGHGLQLEGQNYLVPVDASLEQKANAKMECLNFSTIFDFFQDSKPNVMNIFVIDACRNDPFRNRSWNRRGDDDRGLKLIREVFQVGSFAAFSADNGQLASDGDNTTNGLYTKVLAEEMLTQGVELNLIFQKVRGKVLQLSNGTQRPVEENRLTGDAFYFIPKSDGPAPVPAPTAVVATEKYYYYIDQNGNRSSNRFADWEAAESEMRNRNLYGRIYSNAGESFVVEKPAEPATPAVQPVEPVKTVAGVHRNGDVWNPDGIEMVFVEGGTFMMGCTSEQEDDCSKNEKPAHLVTVSDFYMGKYEVTQVQWNAIMGKNPSNFKGDNLPVEQISWNDVQEFILKLNAQTGKNYRLPTEAEWEFAARGGNSSKSFKYSGSNTAGNVAWYEDNAGDKIFYDKKIGNKKLRNNNKTHPVGTKSSNELGIYDMNGNVEEWCIDWFDNYSSNTQTDPSGPSSGSSRVYRGGSWFSDAKSARVSFRGSIKPGYRSIYLGFRLVCSSK